MQSKNIAKHLNYSEVLSGRQKEEICDKERENKMRDIREYLAVVGLCVLCASVAFIAGMTTTSININNILLERGTAKYVCNEKTATCTLIYLTVDPKTGKVK